MLSPPPPCPPPTPGLLYHGEEKRAAEPLLDSHYRKSNTCLCRTLRAGARKTPGDAPLGARRMAAAPPTRPLALLAASNVGRTPSLVLAPPHAGFTLRLLPGRRRSWPMTWPRRPPAGSWRSCAATATSAISAVCLTGTSLVFDLNDFDKTFPARSNGMSSAQRLRSWWRRATRDSLIKTPAPRWRWQCVPIAQKWPNFDREPPGRLV